MPINPNELTSLVDKLVEQGFIKASQAHKARQLILGELLKSKIGPAHPEEEGFEKEKEK